MIFIYSKTKESGARFYLYMMSLPDYPSSQGQVAGPDIYPSVESAPHVCAAILYVFPMASRPLWPLYPRL